MLRLITVTALLLLFLSPAWSMGLESVGNEPLRHWDYRDWPNAMPVINDTHRVYRNWVNGNEHFYFTGDTKALNAAIKNFVAIKVDRLTVVLRPGPGEVSTFNQKQSFGFNWNLHLLGGISRGVMAKKDFNHHIWDPTPYLHVYVGQAIQLNELELPQGVEVLEIADLQARYAKCLDSGDRTVRGWCCGHIARLDPYNADSMRKVANKLEEDDEWVKSNAVGALSIYTGVANEAIAKLQAVTPEDERLKERIRQSIEVLQKAEPEEAVRKEFQLTLESIHAFLDKHRQER
jgi:hypothetical protein